MEDILSHPLEPLRRSLSPDGLLRKTDKASLSASLQKNILMAEQIQDPFAVVLGVMNREHSIKNSERSASGDETGYQLQNIRAPQIVRQWRKFLSTIKQNQLYHYLAKQMEKKTSMYTGKGKGSVHATVDKCYKIRRC